MALWKDQSKPGQSADAASSGPARFDVPGASEPTPNKSDTPASSAMADRTKRESLIAPDITIEGKIEGAGHVRIAGQFKGDIDVRGDLTIDSNAKVNGSIRAEKVVIAGELTGNIDTAAHVELMPGGVLTGDVKAATMAVAAGAKMRGQADFGWDDSKPALVNKRPNGSDSGHGNGT